MEKALNFVCVVIFAALFGCGQSAQEKVAQEQIKAIEQQKLVLQGFEEAAKKSRAETDTNPVGQEQMKPVTGSTVVDSNKK